MIHLTGAKVLWKINTNCHDWRDGALLAQLIEQASGLGLIDRARWIKHHDDVKPRSLDVDDHTTLASTLSDMISNEDDDVDVEVGGSAWALYLNIYPYDDDLNRVEGINTLWLRFDRTTISQAEDSEKLISAFMRLHSPKNTEYAVIHPYDHWFDFADAHYEIPITIAPMFQGVFWMNFLSGGQLADFDMNELDRLQCHRKHWIDKSGLCFMVAPSLEQVCKPDTEAELLRLTEFFRNALKEDSDWR